MIFGGLVVLNKIFTGISKWKSEVQEEKRKKKEFASKSISGIQEFKPFKEQKISEYIKDGMTEEQAKTLADAVYKQFLDWILLGSGRAFHEASDGERNNIWKGFEKQARERLSKTGGDEKEEVFLEWFKLLDP